jgi:hypothetical protein
LTLNVLDSLPFPRPQSSDPVARVLVSQAARLTCTGTEMMPFWSALAADGWVQALDNPGVVDQAARLDIRCQIEAVVARDVFGLTKEELTHILDSFDGYARKETREFGEYRSKRLALQSFDSEPHN